MQRPTRLALALLLTAPAAHATPLPPPREPRSREAAPVAPAEVLRREHELRLTLGAGVLRCDGAAPSSLTVADPCASLGSSRSLGAAWLWRLGEHWGLGLAGERAWFDWRANGALGVGGGHARWTGLAVAARGYLLSTGWLDPDVGYRIGPGWLTMEGPGGEQLRREGVLMAGSLGLDLWVSSRLKLGVEGEVRWQASGATEVCRGGACLSQDLARRPDRQLGLQATLTVALGDAL